MRSFFVSAAELREMIEVAIAPNIDVYRASKEAVDESYLLPNGSPTADEVDDFICHSPFIDAETLEFLLDPGYLGFAAKASETTSAKLAAFKENLSVWAENNSWLGGDPPFQSYYSSQAPKDSVLWIPEEEFTPVWLSSAPASLLIAEAILREGKLLSDLSWRVFEELVGTLLESDGWKVVVTRPSKDGGIDVLATKADPILGEIKSVWQAKKYREPNKVKLSEVRELSAIRDESRATKGIIVTTSRLTRDAIEWIQRDTYRLAYHEHNQIKEWVERTLLKI